MKKLIIMMDSCQTYTVKTDDVEGFIDGLYNEQRTPSPFGQGSVYHVIRNHIDRLNDHAFINPAHISSIEIMDE